MNDNFILYFLTTFLHRAQVWAEGLDVPQYIESWVWDFNKRFIGTATWEDILKLHNTDKHNVLYHLTHLNTS
jgi:hypothetical protein